MKLLYLTPKINDEGGVQKVLSIRTNYFIEKFEYNIDILTQNNGNQNLFFEFNKKIGLYDMILSGNKIFKIINYKKQIQKFIKISNPDFIIVCDFGLKAFLIPFLIKTKIPIVFEAHGSLYNEPIHFKKSFLGNFFRKIKYGFRKILAKKFDYFIALSNESLQEWDNKNGVIIPNPIKSNNNDISKLANKKVIAVARHSFEKGLDRLLLIWQIVIQKYPNWQLDIYGKEDIEIGLKNLSTELNLNKNINFHEPLKNIEQKYIEASIYVMTSRSEGFPMVLLEAMSFGLPIIAYNCPIGPKSIIENNINGFLIEDGNEKLFAEKIIEIIENDNLRIEIGKNAKLNSEKFNFDLIMNLWKDFFDELKY
jgi:glycosyltransferase involved in cell wall biosynthesis